MAAKGLGWEEWMDFGALGEFVERRKYRVDFRGGYKADKFVKIHRTNILQKGEFYCMSINPRTVYQIPQ